MTVAVIPVMGRLPLIPYTINQALKVVDKVICVTSEAWERDYCKGAVTGRLRRTAPLGEKWNLGFQMAKDYDPDYVLFVGSSDWVSENWMDKLTKYDYEIVGVRGFNLLHLEYKIKVLNWKKFDISKDGAYDIPVKFKSLKVGQWDGYRGERRGEPIGIGRVLNRDFLKRIDYKPFKDKAENSMDYNMFKLSRSHKIVDDDVKCLSISTNLWANMHKFKAAGGRKVLEWFPYVQELTEWTNIKLTDNEIWNVRDA